MSPEPGIDGPPVWIVLLMPYLRAQATISRAVGPSLTPPSPTSPRKRTPAAASSSKSCSSLPASITGAPAPTFPRLDPRRPRVHLHAAGAKVGKAALRGDRHRLEPGYIARPTGRMNFAGGH